MQITSPQYKVGEKARKGIGNGIIKTFDAQQADKKKKTSSPEKIELSSGKELGARCETLVGFIIGHCSLNYHMKNIGVVVFAICN